MPQAGGSRERDQKIRAWLELRLAELTQDVEASLTGLGSDHHHLADLEEMASDVSVDEAVFEQFRSSSDLISQIRRALERIDEGSYDACEVCGKPIGTERLEALPFATQCVACKRLSENLA